MLELALLRHAKSDLGDSGARDIDRPLNSRGEAAAARMGEHLRERSFSPGRILCSPARRACQTLERLGEDFADCARIELDDDLYLASDDTLQAHISGVGNESTPLLIIGHNPGLEVLAAELAGRTPAVSSVKTALAAGFASAAVAIFEVEGGGFADIGFEVTRLVHFATPRGLG